MGEKKKERKRQKKGRLSGDESESGLSEFSSEFFTSGTEDETDESDSRPSSPAKKANEPDHLEPWMEAAEAFDENGTPMVYFEGVMIPLEPPPPDPFVGMDIKVSL